MWKPNQTGSNTPSTPEPVRPSAPATSFDASPTRPATVGAGTAAAAVPTGEQATIGKSLIVKGELTGSESLYIDGKVEGAINLPGNRVTVGRNGQVAANIVAREIVVLGKVRGNLMINLHAGSTKLRDRAVRMVAQLTGSSHDAARERLEKTGWNLRAVLTGPELPV